MRPPEPCSASLRQDLPRALRGPLAHGQAGLRQERDLWRPDVHPLRRGDARAAPAGCADLLLRCPPERPLTLAGAAGLRRQVPLGLDLRPTDVRRDGRLLGRVLGGHRADAQAAGHVGAYPAGAQRRQRRSGVPEPRARLRPLRRRQQLAAAGREEHGLRGRRAGGGLRRGRLPAPGGAREEARGQHPHHRLVHDLQPLGGGRPPRCRRRGRGPAGRGLPGRLAVADGRERHLATVGDPAGGGRRRAGPAYRPRRLAGAERGGVAGVRPDPGRLQAGGRAVQQRLPPGPRVAHGGSLLPLDVLAEARAREGLRLDGGAQVPLQRQGGLDGAGERLRLAPRDGGEDDQAPARSRGHCLQSAAH
mmetsp:Transcript_33665/g.104531  ORF Transcript_33665/g.104531 Transcript_33665/m.104531 type:complete len:362 (+) Transcript_33665:583-1668(+)